MRASRAAVGTTSRPRGLRPCSRRQPSPPPLRRPRANPWQRVPAQPTLLDRRREAYPFGHSIAIVSNNAVKRDCGIRPRRGTCWTRCWVPRNPGTQTAPASSTPSCPDAATPEGVGRNQDTPYGTSGRRASRPRTPSSLRRRLPLEGELQVVHAVTAGRCPTGARRGVVSIIRPV